MRSQESRFASPLVVAMLLACAAAVRAEGRTEAVAAVGFNESDQRVLDEVEALGVVLVRRPTRAALDVAGLTLAAQPWPEARVLVVDSANGNVQVLRRADKTALVRILPRGTLESSPYTAALAATELLGLAHDTPVARAEPVASPGTTPSHALPRADTRLLAAAGGELAASPGHDPTLFRPLLMVGVEFGTVGRKPFVLAHLVATPWGTMKRAIPDVSPDESISYGRSDLGLRLGAGTRLLTGTVLGYLSGGGGLSSASAHSRSSLGEDRRVRGWLGTGGAFRHEVVPSLAVVFGIDLTWLPAPVSYLVRGETTLQEGPLLLGSSLSLALTLR